MGITHPRRFIQVLVCIPLIGAVTTAAADPAEVWLESRYAKNAALGEPLDIEWLFRRSTLRNPSEIRELVNRYADFPDHPELAPAQFHLNLLEFPYEMQHRLLFAGPGAWYFEEALPPSIGQPEEHQSGVSILRSAGLTNKRWMLYSTAAVGQLTIISSGVPYPRTSDVTRYYDIARRRLSAIAFAALPLEGVALISSEHTEDSWSAVVVAGNRGQRFRLTGGWLAGADVPIVTESSDLTEDGQPVTTVTFANHSFVPEFDTAIPMRVEWVRSDLVLEEIFVSGFRRTTARSIRAEATVPDTDRLAVLAPGARVVDFSNPNNPETASLSGGPMMTWTAKRSGDTYEYDESSTTVPSLPIPDSVSTNTKAIQMIAAIVFVLGISTAIVWLRRRA